MIESPVREKELLLSSNASPWLRSSVISLPPRLSCESSLRTHWTMNSFWKLKPLIDDGGGISPAGLIYPGIWVRRENRSRNRERDPAIPLRRDLPAADYHPGMFIKSYDSFRQFLSFIRLKVRLGCRSDCALSASPLTPRTYISSISFINFRNSRDILASKFELSELHFDEKFHGIYIILYSSEISQSFRNVLAESFIFSRYFFLLIIESPRCCSPFSFRSTILRS